MHVQIPLCSKVSVNRQTRYNKGWNDACGPSRAAVNHSNTSPEIRTMLKCWAEGQCTALCGEFHLLQIKLCIENTHTHLRLNYRCQIHLLLVYPQFVYFVLFAIFFCSVCFHFPPLCISDLSIGYVAVHHV